MAKCIKYLSNDTYARLSNDDALAIVITGVAMYTSKGSYHAWLGNTEKAARAGIARFNKITNGIEPPPPRDKPRKSRKQRSHRWN